MCAAYLQNTEISAPVASFQGGLLISQGDARREHWLHFEKRLELCRSLEIKTLVVAGDVLGPLVSKISSGCKSRSSKQPPKLAKAVCG